MKKKFYLDTSIWRDYFEDRKDNLRPLGEFAFQFLKDCDKRSFIVLISDIVISELGIDFSKEQINEIFSSFKKIIKKINPTEEQYLEAKKEWLKRKKKLPLNDVLHAVMARHHKAVLIARDKHFFELLASLVEVQMPEEVIFE